MWLEGVAAPSSRLREVIGELNAVIAVMLTTLMIPKLLKKMERETGFEPATSSLGKQQYVANREQLRQLRQYRSSRIKEKTVLGEIGPLTH
jgi:hypothetical protein